MNPTYSGAERPSAHSCTRRYLLKTLGLGISIAFAVSLAHAQTPGARYFLSSHHRSTKEDLISCKISADDIGRANQSRLFVPLRFKNGKPEVSLSDARLTLSDRFCVRSKCNKGSDGSLLPARKNLLERLSKRINAALSVMRYFDEIARESLFPGEPLREPQEPPEDASEQDQADYQTALSEYRKKKPLLENLNQAINNLELTRQLRNFGGGWPDYFRDVETEAGDGAFEKWRRAVATNEEVKRAFKELWTAYENEEREFVIKDQAAVLNTFFSEPPGEDTSAGSLSFMLTRSSLILILSGEEGGSDYRFGQLCLRTSDPVAADKINSAAQPSSLVSPEDESPFVSRALREADLVGLPWSQEEVQTSLEDFYESLGYRVNLSVSESSEDEKKIDVRKWRINFIRLPKLKDAEIYQVLRSVLPRKAFYEFARNEKAAQEKRYLPRPQEDVSDDSPSQLAIGLRRLTEIDNDNDEFKRLAVNDDYIYFNLFFIQRISAALKDIDYALQIPDNAKDDLNQHRANIDLAIVKTDDRKAQSPATRNVDGGGSGVNKKITPPESNPLRVATDREIFIPASRVLPSRSQLTPPLSPKPTPDQPNAFLPATLFRLCPRFNNYFYVDVNYRPDQGTRLLGGYKCLKAGPGDLSFRFGEDGAALGGVSYSGVVPFTGADPHGLFRRPLLLQLDASTLYERSRLFDGAKTDERRTGIVLRGVLPLQSAADTKQFDLTVEAKRLTVALARNDLIFNKQNLTTLDLGARFFLDRRFRARPSNLELISRLKFGLGLGSEEAAFTMFALNGAFHREANRLFDVDLKGRVALASSRTPIFERPSFGAADTVRGFRQDDAIGLRLWSLQPEVWLRLRGLLSPSFDPATGSVNKLKKFWRDSLSLAAFYDVGGVYRTANSASGTRSGPGLGIRFTYQKQATLKLDWAYGVGDCASGKGRSRFYFSFDLPENPF